MLTFTKTNALTSQSHLTLPDLVRFIRQASPEDFRRILDTVRAVQERHLEQMRKRFKQGDEVEWEIRINAGLYEYLKGKVVAVNRTCCVVAVIASYAPLRFRYCRAPLELLRHVA